MGEAQKLVGNNSNGGKPHIFARSEKQFTENDMYREDPLKRKLATSEGNPVLKAPVECGDDCFQFGAITRKMIGYGDTPLAKKSIFKDERVDFSKNSISEPSHFTKAKKNNKNPTEPYDYMNTPHMMKSFEGSSDFSKSLSTGIEDLTKKSFCGTNGVDFKHSRTSSTHVPSRRKALRFVVDDDLEECRTPIHRITAVSLLREYSQRKSHMKIESCLDSPQDASLSKMDRSVIGNVRSRVDKRPNNVTGNMEMMESCYSASKTCNVEANELNHSADLVAGSNFVKKKCKIASPNPRASNGELEKSRAIPKSNISGLIATENRSNMNISAECYVEKDVSAGQRYDITRETTSADGKLTDSAMSMKHLIAAAQAKRKKAHSLQLLDGSGTPGSCRTPQCVRGRSVDLISTMQTLPSGGEPFQEDKRLFQTSFPTEHPLKQREHEDYNHRHSTGNLHPTDSSSGSTEAAVAREAFEGMIETLSRTRESIGRATRHAIDCAKYGIATEVVKLLIHKLEGEPSLSHRIDLFFLVDSITQCSHTQKGIAGASYVPVVQAALPRLLSAAAPAGASAHENRRQCLKVLRLWLERRILPEYFLRRCMDEIEVLNDGLNSEYSHRIPSCAEQCMDYPIGGMENLLVDQYGSNTTFLFPGILSSHVLEGDEEIPSSPCNGTSGCSPHEINGVSEVLLRSEGRLMEAHHHALKHVENEIEMEDALTVSPDERSIGGVPSYSLAPYPAHRWFVESTCRNQNVLLLLPEGSPPLPLDPPPTPPPLPPSPPPPTPPPPSSPPPMPPLPLSSDLHDNMHWMHQVSCSGLSFRQCSETIQQMPPHSAIPALMIPNHLLTSSQMSLDHYSSTSIDFYHPPHYSAVSRASLSDDTFSNFTGMEFWRPT